LIGAHSALQAALRQLLLERFLQPGFRRGIAASAGMACRALVSADEDVVLEFWHVMVSISNSLTTKDTKLHEGILTLPSVVKLLVFRGETARVAIRGADTIK